MFVTKIVLILLAGISMCEVHMLFYYLYPKTALIEYNDLWMDKEYKYNQTVLWYIFDLGNILAKIIWFYAFAKVALRISYKLFKILVVFEAYFVTQFWFYFWNRNTSFVANNIVYLYMVCVLIMLMIPEKKQQAIVKNIH